MADSPKGYMHPEHAAAMNAALKRQIEKQEAACKSGKSPRFSPAGKR
jgi:hypothetical protein